ncbi:MAG: mucoidy inhibitor MuiA family protein [Bacteriovoracaceae bacterium]|nr:mucoidy inhibitor MuiA family protein [Bacteriovoracaceae bacterium]
MIKIYFDSFLYIVVAFFCFTLPINEFCWAMEAEYQKESVRVKNKINKVTVYSDRALITRSATVKLNKKAGHSTWLLFASLPSNLDKTSLIVETDKSDQVAISQIIIEEQFENTGMTPEAENNIEKLEELYALKLELLQTDKFFDEELYFVQNLKFSAPFNKDGQKYVGFLAPPDQLGKAMTTIRQKVLSILANRQKLQEQIKNIDDKISTLLHELKPYTSLNGQKWTNHVYVQVTNQLKLSRPKKTINLSYMINSAFWHPSYAVRAGLDYQKGEADIRLVTSGILQQNTGENWQDVEATFSSLDPVALFLPKLTRWNFSSRRRAAPMVKKESRRYKRSAKSKGLSRDSFMQDDMVEDMADTLSEEPPYQDLKMGAAMSSKPYVSNQKSRPRRSKRRSVSPYNLFPLAPLGSIFNDLYSLQNNIENLTQNTKGRDVLPRQFMNLKRPRKTHYRDKSLPAVLAKGRLLEMTSLFKVHLGSGKPALKVPIQSQNLRGKLRYFVIPKKDKNVYLKAHMINSTSAPILAGNAQIFMDGNLMSKTKIPTIAEDSFFIVDLGVDKNIEVNRIVTKKAEDKGTLFKEHSTNVEVKIEIVNHHNFPIEIDVKDNYPQTPIDKIKVKLLQRVPPELEHKNSILSWQFKILPRAKKEIVFNYKVTHPDNFIVSEFN